MSAGLAVTGVGLYLVSGVDAGSGWTAVLAGLVVTGAGAGFLAPVVADVALSVVPEERSGMAAGINDAFRQVGISVGVAVWGAIFLGRGAAKVTAIAGDTPVGSGDHARQLVEAASSGTLNRAVAAVPAPVRGVASRAGHEGFIAGFNDIFMLGALLCVVGAALALWLVREREIARAAPVEIEEPEPSAMESRIAA